MIERIKLQLSGAIAPVLVEALLEAYKELKQNYYLGKYKPSELDAGHFTEVVSRILQYITRPDHRFTPLDMQLDNLNREIVRFAQLPAADFHESIRLHIPRALQIAYSIRNRRGVAHVKGEISPNIADSSLLIAICEWVLIELIRLYSTSSLEEAQRIVNTIVERKAPLIQDFRGNLKILNPKMSVPNKILLLLYYRGEDGATIEELNTWIKVKSQGYIQTAISRIERGKVYLHRENDRCFITRSGILFVERDIPLSL